MYDWANSAFITTMVTAVFPIYFATLAEAGGLTGTQATARLGLTTTIALGIGALLAPVLGAIADHAPVKKRFLAVAVVIGAGATGAMFMARGGDWQLAAVLFGLANVAATAGFVFYDSLLPHIAAPDEVDQVSTAGYALGYLGGGFLLAVQVAVMLNPGWFGLETGNDLLVRLVFVSVAAWWLIFTIPLLRRVPEPPVLAGRRSAGGVIGRSLRGLMHTLRELSRFRQALLFMIAFLAYNDGIGTIYRMATIYGKEIGISTGTLIIAILITQFIGVPCAFAFGSIARRIGSKHSIYLGLCVYVVITGLGYFMTEDWHFLVLAALVGLVQGGTQALSRSLFATLIPKQKSGEFFGLFAIFEKFAGIFGPLVFTLVITWTGSSRVAIFAIVGFFAIGAAVLRLVDVDEGRRAARHAEAELAAAVSQT